MTYSVNSDSLGMYCILMASELNSKLRSKVFMRLYKVIVDVAVIYYYYYLKKWLNLKK